MQELNKGQFILLTILVTFVVSIATSIFTVSFLDEAPTTVTQTINRVVERTVERVVPAEEGETIVLDEQGAAVVNSKEPTLTDLIAQSESTLVTINRAQAETAQTPATEAQPIGEGIIVSEDGLVVTNTLLDINPEIPEVFTVTVMNGTVLDADLVQVTDTLSILKIDTSSFEQAVRFNFADLSKKDPDLGTEVFVLYNAGKNVARGLVTGVSDNEYTLDISLESEANGGLVVDMQRKTLGIVIEMLGETIIYPAKNIVELFE